MTLTTLRRDLDTVLRAALHAANPGDLVQHAVSSSSVAQALAAAEHVDVIAVGKAAGPMLAGLVGRSRWRLRSMLGVGPGHRPSLPSQVEWLTAAHPVPDARSVEAARRVIAVAAAAGERDALLVLLSGGASALMALPAHGLTLEDKQLTVQLLLLRGADIYQLNAVRKHLSGVKGGLLAAATRASVTSLVISDVMGDDLSVIGSGPTVPDPSTFEMALTVLERRGGIESYPSAVAVHLMQGAAGDTPETPKTETDLPARSTAVVIGSLKTAIDGAARAAASIGYDIHILPGPISGEARDAAAGLVAAATAVPRIGGPLCVIAGGETTVHVRGRGVGGRNQELALAMAPMLEAHDGDVVALSAGTDGIDGPTTAAGAIVDSTTAARARAAGLDISHYLDNNDSHTFFIRLADLVETGPTGTNVGDIQILLMT